MKQCRTCREWKIEEDFGWYARAKDGLQYDCRACRGSDRKTFYKANGKYVVPIQDAIQKEGQDKVTEKMVAAIHAWTDEDMDRMIARASQAGPNESVGEMINHAALCGIDALG